VPTKESNRSVALKVDYQPHEKQMEIFRSPARFKVIAAGRRSGKTEGSVVKLLFGDAAGFPGAIRGSRVWWIAPDYPRALYGWNLGTRFARDLPPGIVKISQENKKLEFPHSEGFFQVKSGFDPNSLRGEKLSHATFDEAGFMEEAAWVEGVRPALADLKGSADFISTPNGFNFFYDLYERGMAEEGGEWQSFRFTSYDNPHVDNAEIDAAWEDYKRQGNEHIFRQEFLAQFLEGGGLPVFKREWWADGRNRFDPNDRRLLENGIGWWIAGDTANRDKDEAARSVFIVGQFTPDYKLLIRDAVWGRWTFDQLYQVASSLAYRYRGSYLNSLRHFYVEDAASGIALLHTMQNSGPVWLRSKATPVKPKPKEVNWNEAAMWCARDFVKLPYPDESNRSWLMEFENEVFNVPGAKYFDFADSFSILVNQLKLLFASAHRGAA
jgi:hypothetical protein